MADENNATVLSSEIDQDRQKQLEALFSANYGDLLNMALTGDRLFVADGENIVQGVAQHLGEYNGEIDETSFLEWAKTIIQPAADRLAQWYAMRQEHEGVVFRSLWQVILKAEDLTGDDPVGTVRALADEVWLWAFENLDSLQTPGTAKLATRLYAKARWIGRGWKTVQLRERDKKADLDVMLLEASGRWR